MSDQADSPSYEPYQPYEPEVPREQRDVIPMAGHVPAVPTPYSPVAAPHGGRPTFVQGLPLQAFLVPSIICTLIWLMTSPGDYFWPMWVMFGTGIPLIIALVNKLR